MNNSTLGDNNSKKKRGVKLCGGTRRSWSGNGTLLRLTLALEYIITMGTVFEVDDKIVKCLGGTRGVQLRAVEKY